MGCPHTRAIHLCMHAARWNHAPVSCMLPLALRLQWQRGGHASTHTCMHCRYDKMVRGGVSGAPVVAEDVAVGGMIANLSISDLR